ncbi:MAG: CHAT domain-containing protein [Pelomonas sp.]|nr:CHAT domain-containing protein [Roseateles sp.]
MTTTRPDAAALNSWFGEHLKESHTAQRATRSGTGNGRASFPAADFQHPDAVLSVHFADGSVFHTAPQDWLDHVSAADPATPTRSTSSDGQTGMVELPFELRSRLAPLTRSSGGRPGDGGPLIERYALARLTEPTTLDRVYGIGAWAADQVDRLAAKASDSKLPGAAGMAGGLVGAKLCFAFETSQLHAAVGDDAGVLLHFPREGAAPEWQPWQAPAGGGGVPDDRDVVLFLHGTASSTTGSYGALSGTRDAAEPQLPQDFAALRERCTLLAWEHRSLSASPVRNARDAARVLAQVLPARARLHLVSHSRGGMVGDLLSLALMPAADRAAYSERFKSFYAAEEHAHPDAALLDDLFAALDDMGRLGLQPGTFVRVASPSRGTLLADRRTDLFLSLLLRCVGLVSGTNGNPWYETFNGFVRSFVAARADARLVPGLEAMIPGSLLTLALNAMPEAFDPPLPKLPGALRVIAGDAVASGFGGLFTLLSDAFYGLHDHDYVVHTHSMFGGFQRSDARSLRLERKGVNHLAYFKADAPSRAPLFNALAGDDRDFRPLLDDERITRGLPQLFKPQPLSRLSPAQWRERWAKDAGTRPQDKPILVVLPGIMGSELALQDGSPVWLGLGALLTGRLRHLPLDPANPGNTALRASGLVPTAYERLLVEAERHFRVMAWPYDWRRSIDDLGADLRQQLDQLLADERTGDRAQAVHLLAHSMGGLVARSALFKQRGQDAGGSATGHCETQTWLDIKKLGGRLVMLGTPNLGSYAPVQLLAQQHRMSQLLAIMARQVSGEDMARYGAGFDGLLQMLPAEPSDVVGDLFVDASWRALQRSVPSVQRPDSRTLKRASELRAWRDQSFAELRDKADPHVLYVAGSGLTPVGLALPPNPGGALAFRQTMAGDGTVPWLSTLKPAQTWYANCSHGDLGDYPAAFEAYFELLRQGRTARLAQQPPVGALESGTRAGSSAPQVLPALAASAIHGAPTSLPDDPAAFALGISGDRGAAGRARLPDPPIVLSLVHGSLDYARFPLIVGHNLDEGLAGGTRRVDEKLDGQLQDMIDLKLFVGADRTSAYLRPPARDHRPPPYPGALVLGLGAVGEMTPSSLTGTVTRGVLRYAFEHLTRDCWVEGDGLLPLRLSTLLVGTHMQTVTFRDSLASVILGVWNANQHLAGKVGGRSARVVELEIIEIQEHSALDAAYELERLLNNPDWARRAVWPDGTLQTRDGGLFGYRRRTDDSVWQRLIVGQAPLGGLKFELISERARVEATQVRSDVASLSSFVQQLSDDGAVASRQGRDEERALGQVFFQLLLPQALKDRMTNFEQTVLVLDDRSAAYPWELMTPPEDDVGDGDGGVRPLSVQAGMVRQRVTTNYRTLPQTRNNFEALVIGAPSTANWTDREGKPLRFAALPAAQREARSVGTQLQQDTRPWRITSLVGDDVTSRHVRMALLARPYRLLHISAHGAHNQWVSEIECLGMRQPLRKTGVLLSDQEVLSAADVEQMGNVPEFVFINCCYLGQDADRAGLAPVQRNDPEMASGLALKFIEMGTKAVVAAGWQVQDEAGALFASRLYEGLLRDGLDFGTAVLEARRAVRDAHPGNTWGAYQCYGDPNWRVPASGGGDGQGLGGSSHLRGSQLAKSPGELTSQLMKVKAVAGDKPRDALRQQLRSLIASLEADTARAHWLADSRVASALSTAWRELGEYALALQALHKASREMASAVSMSDIEFAANSLARTGSSSTDGAPHALLAALDGLEDALRTPPPAGAGAAGGDEAPSPGRVERISLRGSAELRRAAWLLHQGTSNKRETASALRSAAGHYLAAYAAWRKAQGPVDRRCFALANGLLCAGLATLFGAKVDKLLEPLGPGPGHWEHDVQALLEELKACELSAQFWHYTGAFELRNGRALLRVALGNVPEGDWLQQQFDAGLQLLRVALVRWPSPAEKDSLTMRLEMMRAACERPGAPSGSGAALAHVGSALEMLRERSAPG